MALGDQAAARGDLATGMLSGMQLYRLASLADPTATLPRQRMAEHFDQAVSMVQLQLVHGDSYGARRGALLLNQILPSDPRVEDVLRITSGQSGIAYGVAPSSPSPSTDDRPRDQVGLNEAWKQAVQDYQPSLGNVGSPPPSSPPEKDATKSAAETSAGSLKDSAPPPWPPKDGAPNRPPASSQPAGDEHQTGDAVSTGQASDELSGHAHHKKKSSKHSDTYASAPGAHGDVVEHSLPNPMPPPPPPPPAAPPTATPPTSDPLAQSTQSLNNEVPANAVYNTPKSMNLKETKKIELFLSVGHSADEMKGQITAPGPISQAKFGVTDRVKAEIKSADFTVEPETDAEQLVGKQNVVHWVWLITPKTAGAKRHLSLVVQNIVRDGNSDVSSTILAYEREIDVDVTVWQQVVDFEQKNWQWEASTLVIPLAVVGWNSRKKKRGAYKPAYGGKYQPRSKKDKAG